MSHWTTVKTKIKDKERMEEALDDLDIKHEEKDGKIYLGNSGYVYLEEEEDGSYKLKHDFYYAKDITQKTLDNLMNRYTFRKAESEARTRGFAVADEEVMADGSIKFKLRKWL